NCGGCGVVCANGKGCVNSVCVLKPKVLIAFAATPAYATDVQNNLNGTNAFTTVDVFNAAAATPTVAQLQAYDVVMTFSDSVFQGGTTLGSNLSSRWQGGGYVVHTTYGLCSGFGIGGACAANILLAEGPQEQPTDSMTVVNANSPIISGVATLTATAAYRCTG